LILIKIFVIIYIERKIKDYFCKRRMRPMFRQEDILKKLQEGAEASAIANEFANALNAAIAQKNAEDAAKNAYAAEKVARMQEIVNAVVDFVQDYYPEFNVPEDVKDAVTAEGIIASMEDAKKDIMRIQGFVKSNKNIFGDVPVVKVKKTAAPVAKADAIAEFLKANGLA
jgi:hypothetical protein